MANDLDAMLNAIHSMTKDELQTLFYKALDASGIIYTTGSTGRIISPEDVLPLEMFTPQVIEIRLSLPHCVSAVDYSQKPDAGSYISLDAVEKAETSIQIPTADKNNIISLDAA